MCSHSALMNQPWDDPPECLRASSKDLLWFWWISLNDSDSFLLCFVFPARFAYCAFPACTVTHDGSMLLSCHFLFSILVWKPERTWNLKDELTNQLEVSVWGIIFPLNNKITTRLQILPFYFAACLLPPTFPNHLSLLLFFTYVEAGLHPPPEPLRMKEWTKPLCVPNEPASVRVCRWVMSVVGLVLTGMPNRSSLHPTDISENAPNMRKLLCSEKWITFCWFCENQNIGVWVLDF